MTCPTCTDCSSRCCPCIHRRLSNTDLVGSSLSPTKHRSTTKLHMYVLSHRFCSRPLTPVLRGVARLTLIAYLVLLAGSNLVLVLAWLVLIFGQHNN